jgi:leucyl aminopeptidase
MAGLAEYDRWQQALKVPESGLANQGLSAYIAQMDKKSLTAEEKALKAQQKRFESDKALADHRAREEAINRNTERLRALRLARDAQNPPPEPTPKAKKKQPKASLADYLKRETESGRKT